MDKPTWHALVSIGLLSKDMRKMTHGIIINPLNVNLFMVNLFIYLFIKGSIFLKKTFYYPRKVK